MRKLVPETVSAGLILSYKCSAGCLHCMYACSPQWNGDWISEENLEKILSQLAGTIQPSFYGPGGVGVSEGLHFTGGEPFLNFELLCTAVSIARELHIPSTFVETNCFWCKDDKVTQENMEFLKNCGLAGIMISVNPFYLEYVPFERTERAIRIGLEVFGRNVMVYQLEYFRRFKAMGIKGTVAFKDYLGSLETAGELVRNVEFFMMGRAAYKLSDVAEGLFSRFPAHYFLGQPCSPPFLRNWHNHLDNYGNYMPGFCGGISLGDCRELDRLLTEGIETDDYSVLGFLMNEDMEGLLLFSRDFGYEQLESGYVSKCHLCMDMRMHLNKKQDFKELRPREFYYQLEH